MRTNQHEKVNVGDIGKDTYIDHGEQIVKIVSLSDHGTARVTPILRDSKGAKIGVFRINYPNTYTLVLGFFEPIAPLHLLAISDRLILD